MAKKKGFELKSFGKITLNLTIEGGNIMDYRIEKRDCFKISAIVRNFNLQTSQKEIPEFWKDVKEKGILNKFSKTSTRNVVGICLGDYGDEEFQYGIGAELENEEEPIKGSEIIEIPESLWVVFKCKGQNPKDINELWSRIYKEYFLTSE